MLHPMAEEKIQGNLPQSRQANSVEFPTSDNIIQDRLRSQNAALAAEKIRLQQECANLKALLSTHIAGKDCLYHQQQSFRAP